MNRNETRESLKRQEEILDKIAANTAAQERFVRRHELRGLRRLLRERAALLERLADVAGRPRRDAAWRQDGLFAAELEAIERKSREIIDASRRVIQAAAAERLRLAAEIGKSRRMRQAKSNYVDRWAIMTFGSRLNIKG